MFSVVCYSPRMPRTVVASLFAFPPKILLHMHITAGHFKLKGIGSEISSEARTEVVILRSRLHLIYVNIIDIYLVWTTLRSVVSVLS